MKSHFSFCDACNCNHSLGKKHIYGKKHQEIVQKLMLKALKNVEDVIKFMKHPHFRMSCSEQAQFWCLFCNMTIEDSSDFIGNDIFEHLASEKHILGIKKYCARHNADKDRTMRGKLVITLSDFQKYRRSCQALANVNDTDVTEIQKKPKNNVEEEFLSSVAKQLEARKKPIENPSLPIFQQPMKTIISENGIKQNLSGRHLGERVWGGGIVAVPPKKWVPWPIDLLTDLLDKEINGETNMNSNIEIKPRAYYTEIASGSGLMSIKRLPSSNRGNVHSGAIPPWISSSTLSDESDTWLPNFGSVWQQGTRSTTKKEFIQVKQKQRVATLNGTKRNSDNNGNSSYQTNFPLKNQDKISNSKKRNSDESYPVQINEYFDQRFIQEKTIHCIPNDPLVVPQCQSKVFENSQDLPKNEDDVLWQKTLEIKRQKEKLRKKLMERRMNATL